MDPAVRASFVLGYYLERAHGEKLGLGARRCWAAPSVRIAARLCGLLGGRSPRDAPVRRDDRPLRSSMCMTPLVTVPGTGDPALRRHGRGPPAGPRHVDAGRGMAPIGRLMSARHRPPLPAGPGGGARRRLPHCRPPQPSPRGPNAPRHASTRSSPTQLRPPQPEAASGTSVRLPFRSRSRAPASSPRRSHRQLLAGSTRERRPVREATPAVAGDGRRARTHIRSATARRSGGIRPPVRAPAQSKLGPSSSARRRSGRPARRRCREYHLPPLALLDDTVPPKIGDNPMDHERNAAIIEAKLASFTSRPAWSPGTPARS